MMTNLTELGDKMLRIETLYPDQEQYNFFQHVAGAEQMGGLIDDSNFSNDFLNFIDLATIRMPCTVTSQLKFLIANLSNGDKDTALLFLAAVKSLAEKHDLKSVGAAHLISHYEFNVPDAKSVKKLASDPKVKSVLVSPVSWSV